MPDEDTYTITGGPLKPHEYVVVRREMTAGDEAWIQNHSASLSGDNKKTLKVELTIGDVKLAALKRLIVSWHLTKQGPSGQQELIPLSHKAIENLPRRISAYVNKVIDDLNPDEEESWEDFTHAANGSSEGSSKTEKTPQPKG